MPEVSYIDTMLMSASVLNIGSLEAACRELNIDFGEHHNALSDAEACMRLFCALKDSYDDLPEAVWANEDAGSISRSSGGARAVKGLGLTNGTHERIEDVLNALDAMGLRGNLDELGTVSGHRFVVSGRVAGYAGSPSEPGSIESVLMAVGAKTSNRVSGKTEYLAIGDNAGAKKISDAKSRGVPVVTVGELLELLSRSPAVE